MRNAGVEVRLSEKAKNEKRRKDIKWAREIKRSR
jgi:hypothetical protein